MYEVDGLPQTFDDLERVGKVFWIKVTAQFAGGNSVVGNFLCLDQLFFHTGVRTDIRNLIAGFSKTGKQGNMWSYMAGGAAACHNNFFHGGNPF